MNHQELARAVREIVSRVVGGFFRGVTNERTVYRLADEHAAALMALRRHHDRMIVTHGDRYSSSRIASFAGKAHPEPELAALFDATYFALMPLRLAEKQIAAEQGKCSNLDKHDIEAFEARGVLFRMKTRREQERAAKEERRNGFVDDLDSVEV